MSTQSQIAANQANSQHSTGPQTPEGKAASSVNNLHHGLAGSFCILACEEPTAFENLRAAFLSEHLPTTPTEEILIIRLAEHHWLRQRALNLQAATLSQAKFHDDVMNREIALYARYQSMNERAFSKCLADLLKLRSERRKAEIGFESQKARQAQEIRKIALHKPQVRFAEARTEAQILRNIALETRVFAPRAPKSPQEAQSRAA